MTLLFFSFLLLFVSCTGEMIDAMLILPSHIPIHLHIPGTTTTLPPPPPFLNCKNQFIGRIIAMNIKKDARLAEKAVEVAIREQYPGPWFVSCGYEDLQFSKISPNYCEFSNGAVFCYAFQPYQVRK